MTRTRIKFCGMTNAADALAAARLGVDAVGLVFTSRSPRAIGVAQACEIVRELPPMVATVALFLDDAAAWVREVERKVKPALLQFHGTETDAYCAAFDTPYLKAIAMNSVADVSACLDAYPHARGFLLDGHAAGGQGGQGKTFDFSRIPQGIERPILLAGGLDADNVAAAIERVRPWAVDVSSGIEVSPGVKSHDKMQAFVKAVQSVQKP